MQVVRNRDKIFRYFRRTRNPMCWTIARVLLTLGYVAVADRCCRVRVGRDCHCNKGSNDPRQSSRRAAVSRKRILRRAQGCSA